MTARHIKTAIIGIGRWGKNVAQELAHLSDLIAYVSSGSPKNIAWAEEHLPSAAAHTLEEVCANSSIEGVAITTPIATHENIARMLLKSGKHVLVEKPTAETSERAFTLAREAASRDLTLATGYIFLYHPVYEELRRRIPVSSIRSMSCTWKKYGTFRESIEYNLLTHHLALAYDLLGMPRSGVLKRGRAVESECDKVETTLEYKNAKFTSSIDRASEQRQHTIEIKTENNTVFLWDGNTLTVTESDKIPRIVYTATDQSLTREIGAFLDAVETKDPSRFPTGDSFGAHVLEVHEKLVERTSG